MIRMSSIARLHFMFYICQTCRMNAIFWSNKVYPGIWRSSLNGSGVLPVLTNNSDIGKCIKSFKHVLQCIVIDEHAGRIAIDWISDKLYWSDYYRNTINVIDLHTGHQNALFTLSAYKPYDILVDPNSRYAIVSNIYCKLTSKPTKCVHYNAPNSCNICNPAICWVMYCLTLFYSCFVKLYLCLMFCFLPSTYACMANLCSFAHASHILRYFSLLHGYSNAHFIVVCFSEFTCLIFNFSILSIPDVDHTSTHHIPKLKIDIHVVGIKRITVNYYILLAHRISQYMHIQHPDRTAFTQKISH